MTSWQFQESDFSTSWDFEESGCLEIQESGYCDFLADSIVWMLCLPGGFRSLFIVTFWQFQDSGYCVRNLDIGTL